MINIKINMELQRNLFLYEVKAKIIISNYVSINHNINYNTIQL